MDYFKPDDVDKIFSSIRENSSRGASVVFSYPVHSAIEGSPDTEVTKNISILSSQLGEPVYFRICEGTIEDLLSRWGFRLVRNITGEDMNKACFHGQKEGQRVYSQGWISNALVE